MREGEALGIVGHNGMGKTTLLKTLVGLLPATGGRITLDGIDVTREPAHARSRRGLAYVPQGRGILPGLTTLDNLRLAWTGDSQETEQEAVDRCVVVCSRAWRRCSIGAAARCPGGEQQILALARALVPNPWILLLDEPSEGIQPSIVQEIGQILARLKTEARLAIVIVEQNLDLVLDVADAYRRARARAHRARVQSRRSRRRQCAGRGARAGLGAHDAQARRAAARAAASSRPARTGSPPRRSATAQPVPRLGSTARGTHPFHRPESQPAMHRPRAGVSMTSVKRPTLEQMKEIVTSLHMSMSDREIAEYLDVIEGTMQAYDRLQQLPDNLPPVRYPRTPGYRPGAAENPLNAWAVKSEVRGAAYGPLAGKRVVLKDNVCLAGVPMMNGASTLEGYVPDVDATVVTRILDAGGTIVGKAHCEYFCLSGGSHTSALGSGAQPVQVRLLGGRLVVRLGRAGRCRRSRDGDRRRPGRLDPHAGVLERLLRHEGRRTGSFPTPA